MSKLELIRDFYDYNEWANGRLLKVASGLGDDNVSYSPGASLAGVVATMAHIAAAQINWLERWQGGVNRVSTVELVGNDALSGRSPHCVWPFAKRPARVHSLADRR